MPSPRPPASTRPTVFASLCLLLAAACSEGILTAPGRIDLRVLGLPDGVAASVEVAGPDGYASVFERSAALFPLEPGTYTLRAASVQDAQGHRFAPVVTELQAEVLLAGRTAVEVVYAERARPVLELLPARLELSAVVGSSGQGRVELRNAGGAPLELTVAPLDSWLALAGAASATVAPGESAAVDVAASCAQVGTVDGALQIDSNAEPARVELPVTLYCTATPQPRLGAVQPDPLRLAASIGSAASGALLLHNVGTAKLTWSGSTTGASWLALSSPSAGSLAPDASAELGVSASCSSVGSFDGQVTIASNDPVEPNVSIAVKLECSRQPIPDITAPTPSPVVMQAELGRSAQAQLTFGNEGGASLAYQVVESAAWLAVQPASGTVAIDASATLTATGTCGATAGMVQTTLSISSDDPDEPTKTVLFSLECVEPPAPDLGAPTPNPVQIAGVVGRASTSSLSFANVGELPLDFTATPAAAWLAASPASGRLASGATQRLELTATCPASAGALSTTLTLATNDADTPSLAVPVRLDCVDLPDLDLRFDRVRFIQVTQDATGSVPLVAGWVARVRAFVVASAATSGVTVRLTALSSTGATLGTVNLTAPATVPTAAPSTDAPGTSFDGELPAAWLQPGLQAFLEIDPANALAENDEANNRYPASGATALTVRQVGAWPITFVPVTQQGASPPDLSSSNAAGYLDTALRLEPVVDYSVQMHATYDYDATIAATDGASWSNLLYELRSLRTSEGSSRHYIGVVNPSYSGGIAGIGFVGLPVAVVWDSFSREDCLAHEVGHNWGRDHAPCGVGSDYDTSYPYANAKIGVWGYDRLARAFFSPSTNVDFMSYCDPVWTSDYTFKAILSYRQAHPYPVAPQPAAQVLMVRGAIRGGRAELHSAFQLFVPPTPPVEGGWRIEARDAQGRALAAAYFAPDEVAGMDDAHFAFTLPLSEQDAAQLASISLFDPQGELVSRRDALPGAAAAPAVSEEKGRTRVDWNAAYGRELLVRDPESGQTLAITRRSPLRLPSLPDGLELLVSDGVRTARHLHSRR